ncbi:MAG: DUF559 domain-containing protein [Kordiimonadaceae bacterium]|nr:DUF559 domain-containing protein [Kordiimonadaceae bacterium]
MKYPGQPKSPPSWYKDRGQSYIEKGFSKELGDLADAIESEHWFGDPQNLSRYRVDFVLKDAQLVIELDGHAYHSTPEQLEKDAIRQRYLTRAGYSVIRFTGREINKNTAACVSDVRTIYKERMQRAPAKYRVMYVDYPFLYREMSKALAFYRGLHPNKDLSFVPLEELIPYAIEGLHEKSFVTVFVFHPPEDTTEIEHLDGFVKEYSKGEIRINTISAELYSLELGEHMKSYSHLFDEFFLIADDPVYIEPLRSVLPKEFSERNMGNYTHHYLANGKLLRKGNDETSFVGTDLAHVQWQDVWYIIGASMGLSLHEL